MSPSVTSVGSNFPTGSLSQRFVRCLVETATEAACRSLRTFQSSHPSDDINIGVRSTRGYHARHLPPCRFLAVRRFTPPTPCLFCFIQAPSMGFKERVDFTSTRDRSDPENLTDLEHERRVSAKDRTSDGFCPTRCCPLSSFLRRPGCQWIALSRQAQTPFSSDEASPSR
jgi:hypothetical protein